MPGLKDKEEPTVVVTRPAYNIAQFHQDHKNIPTQNKSTLDEVKHWTKNKFTCTRTKLLRALLGFFPVMLWLPKYKVRYIPGDLIAGWTVGIIRIPQGMAYALLANVSPVYGLYSCFFPVLIWFIFSTSKHTSIGTMAVICLMIQNLVDKYVPEDDIIVPKFNNSGLTLNGELVDKNDLSSYVNYFSNNSESILFNGDQYLTDQLQERADMRIQIASTATLLVGIIQLCMGLLRLGFLTKFLSDPVVQGFTTGAAFHVMTSQVKYMFGFTKEVAKYSGPFAIVKTFVDIFKNLGHVNVAELLITIICLPSILIVKHLNEKYKKKMHNIPFPIELILVVAGTLASYFGNFHEKFRVNIVSDIPTGLPTFTVPPYTYLWGEMITDCIIMAVVGFAISLSLTKIYSDKHGYEIDANQELIALGFCNTIPAFLSCFAIAASLSRTAIQESSGGNTQLVSILSSVLMLIVLLWLGPLFEPVPKAILACIIICALKGLFMQFYKLKPLWKVSKIDCVIWVTTLLAVILLGVDIGLAVGIGAALFAILFRLQRPTYVSLGRIQYTDIYADVSRYTDAQEVDGVKIFHFTDSPCFNNKDLFKELLIQCIGFNPALMLAKKRKMDKVLNDAEGGDFRSTDETIELRVMESSEVKREETPTTSESVTLRRRNIPTADEDESIHSPLLTKTMNSSVGFHTLILDATKWSFLDSTAAREISSQIDTLHKIGVRVLFASASESIMDTLSSCWSDVKQMHEHSFLSVHDACVFAERSYKLSQVRRVGEESNEYELLPDYPGFDALAL